MQWNELFWVIYMDKTAEYYDSNRTDEKVMGYLDKQYQKGKGHEAEAIAGVSSFHLRGRVATVSLAASVDIGHELKILDVGSGPGGTARYLSETFSSQVIGLDLTYAFSRLAKKLSEKSGLPDSTRFVCANALDIPFGNEKFDMVWLEHVQMNIRNKTRLVAELYRVLKPGGTLAIYEVFQVGSRPPEYPLPWADTPEVSFLIAPGKMKQLLETTGFNCLKWHDCLDEIRAWIETRRIKESASDNLLTGVELLMGDRADEKVKNLTDAVMDKRLTVIEGVLKKL